MTEHIKTPSGAEQNATVDEGPVTAGWPQVPSMPRRGFLAAAGATAVAASLPSQAWARKPRIITRPAEKNKYDALRSVGTRFDRAVESTGGPIKLKPWAHGGESAAADSVLMFRGDPSHTFQGTGSLPATEPKVLWKHRMIDFGTKYYGKPHTWRGTGWTGQAVFYDGHVFVGSVGRSYYAFEAATGKVRWRFQSGRQFKASSCFYDNHIYIGSVDNYLRCIDATNGTVKWKIRYSRDLDSSACVVGGKLYIAGENGHARCLDPKTGNLLWKTFVGGLDSGSKKGSYGSETSPAVVDGEFYCGTYDGRLVSLNTSDGSLRWEASTGDDTDASPVVAGDYVYAASQDKHPFIHCFRRSDGTKVWEHRERGGFWATPAVVGGVVYVGSAGGKFVALDALTGKQKWVHKIGSWSWSSPIVLGDRVLFGAFDGKLRCLNIADGKLLWTKRLGGRVHTTPCVVDSKIYMGSASGWFYALGA